MYSIGVSVKVIIVEVNNVIIKVMFNGISICFFIFVRKNKGIKLIIIIKVEFKIGICIFFEVLNMILIMFLCFFLGNK